MVESIPQSTNAPQEISLNLDPRTGKLWYLDKDHRVVVLTEEHAAERDRQQMDPASEPSPGHDKYSPSITMAQMPVAEGEIAPEHPNEPEVEEEVPADGAGGAKDKVRTEPPFADMAERTRTQDMLRGTLKQLEGTGVNLTVLNQRINDVSSPSAAKNIAADIELLKGVKSPLREKQRAPWKR